MAKNTAQKDLRKSIAGFSFFIDFIGYAGYNVIKPVKEEKR